MAAVTRLLRRPRTPTTTATARPTPSASSGSRWAPWASASGRRPSARRGRPADVRAAPALRAVLGGLLLVVLTAAPAAADPAGPSDFRSEVTDITPTAPG